MANNMYETIKVVAETENLTEAQVIEAITEGLIFGCKRTHQVSSCRAFLDEEKGEFKVFKQYLVVAEYDLTLTKVHTQLLLEDAKKLDPQAKVGDLLEFPVKQEDFSPYGMRDFKQRYKQVILDYSKENIFDYFKDKEHQMMRAKIIDEMEHAYKISLGKETTLLPKTEILDRDKLHVSDDVYVYISSVEMKSKGPKIYVSRKDKGLVVKLMELNIPEISEGIVEIVGISRVPGERSKVGVRSHDSQVDPIGACVGEGGGRIKEIVNALAGEKIDLFRWSDNERELIENALQPADVIAVTKVNPKEKSALAIVPDDQLSLAIGKIGQNVKLAVQASGWSIDIKSEKMAFEEGILY